MILRLLIVIDFCPFYTVYREQQDRYGYSGWYAISNHRHAFDCRSFLPSIIEKEKKEANGNRDDGTTVAGMSGAVHGVHVVRRQ